MLKHPDDIKKMSIVELDDYACKLSRTIDSLELAYTDYNGDWFDKARRREWERLTKLRNIVDRLLDNE